ncbi:hypothetical protein [Microbacterium sp. K41]|uniref:hypothetical protein n=1 Tax=Microbacterium sp. K41 TaxID=2305437 RepID=UPI00109C6530|nr:hypothetical protein [Microbacterium sp. K41]
MRDYDATREYIKDRDKEPRDQSTASLLLSLANAVVINALAGDIRGLDDALRLWGEAERRITALDEVFRAGISDQAARAIIARVVLEHLHASGRIDIADVTGAPLVDEGASWLEAATLSAEHTASRTTRRTFLDLPDKSILSQALPQLFDSEDEIDELVSNPVIAHTLTETFRRRVIRWLGNLLPVDLTGTLSARAPHAPMFAALEPIAPREPIGSWLWDRFTVTRIEDWTTASLSLEWDWASHSRTAPCNARAMAERVVDADTTSRHAMIRSLRNYARPQRSAEFNSSEYVGRASELLISGKWEAASQIFEGVVALSPGDAVAWNNLAFCRLAAEPGDAITMLRRAEALSRTPSLVTAANLSLALHLVGKHDEALRIGSAALEWADPSHSSGAWLWEHPAADRDADLDAELVLGYFSSVREYLETLLEHLGHPTATTCSAALAGESG